MNLISGTGNGPLTRRILQILDMETKAPKEPKIEMKSHDFELKASDDETNIIEGYAATFGGSPDSYGDIIKQGAFKKTLQENGDRIKFLWSHNWNEVIGRVVEAREDSKGLFIKVKISDIQRGRETMTMIKDGTIDRMSIGYRTIQYDYDSATGIRTLKEVRLFEVSAVPIPANDNAIITGAKNDDLYGDESYSSGIDAIAELVADVKAGRAISAKTKTAIVNAIDDLKSAQGSLETLLDAVDNDEEDTTTGNEDDTKAQEIADMVKSFMKDAELTTSLSL